MPADIKLKWQQEAGGTDAHYSQTFIKPLLDYKYLHLHFTLTHIIRHTRLGTHWSTGRLTSHQPAVIHDIWAISNHYLVHYQELGPVPWHLPPNLYDGILLPLQEVVSTDQILFMLHLKDQHKVAHDCDLEGKWHGKNAFTPAIALIPLD